MTALRGSLGRQTAHVALSMPSALVCLTSALLSFGVSQSFAQDGTVEQSESFPRLRLGGSAGLGEGSIGIAAAASARAGLQIRSSWAVSYQLSAAGTAQIFGNSDTWTSHALLVEFTVPEKLITLGGGPSFVSGHIDRSCGLFCVSPPPSDYKGVGFDWRVGFTLGARRPRVRGGFTVELAGHHTAHDTAVVVGIGADLF